MKLELDGLTKEFGDFTAVNHINLTMTNGVYGLLGVNGAGKTTLMRMLCTLLSQQAERYAVMEKIFLVWTANIVSCWGIYHRILILS